MKTHKKSTQKACLKQMEPRRLLRQPNTIIFWEAIWQTLYSKHSTSTVPWAKKLRVERRMRNKTLLRPLIAVWTTERAVGNFFASRCRTVQSKKFLKGHLQFWKTSKVNTVKIKTASNKKKIKVGDACPSPSTQVRSRVRWKGRRRSI